MQPQPTLRFDYRVSRVALVLMFALSAALPALFAYAANNNRKGLRISGLTFTAEQATMVYWLLAAVMLLGTVAAIASVVGNLRSAGFVELGATEALLPKASLRPKLLKIPYASIIQVQMQDIPGQQMLIVRTLVGEARLSSAAFKSAKDFSRFLRVLKERTGKA